jgi:hypothetical protein
MEEPQNKTADNFRILGINLGVMFAYTVLCKYIIVGAILDSGFLLLHVIFCWGAAIAAKNWMWFLAGLLVLLIGASTCVTFLFN